MFCRRQPTRPDLAAQSPTVEPTGTADDPTLRVLTRSEVLSTVNLLEDYIQLSSNEDATELASTLIVRLLDTAFTTTMIPKPLPPETLPPTTPQVRQV